MLTRIEIDGFKSFRDFGLDLLPFAVILGPNASGKSNLFDAIQFLSWLAHRDLKDAVDGVRGEADDLFRRLGPERTSSSMRFCVEVLLESQTEDPWGTRVELSHTRVRYEVVVEKLRDDRGMERLAVTHEQALPILEKTDSWKKLSPRMSKFFRETYLRYARRSPFLETSKQGLKSEFRIRQDGKAGRVRPAHIPGASVLSSITTAEFPHLFALREEMRSWRFLQLDPSALRRHGSVTAPEMLLPDGSNLATVLARIKAETRSETEPNGALSDITAELVRVIPGVLDVDVEFDSHTREYRAFISTREGHRFPTRVISDGTLRVLALLTLLYDPQHRGLVCFEEPENGVHPARLRTLIGRLRELVTDVSSNASSDAYPLSQLLLNSHSPVVLSALSPARPGVGGLNEVFFADSVGIADSAVRRIERRTRMRPVSGSDQCDAFGVGFAKAVPSSEVRNYLATVDREG